MNLPVQSTAMYLPVFARIADTLATAKVMLSAGRLDQARLQIDKVRLLRSTVKRQVKRAQQLTTEEWGAELTGEEFVPAEMLSTVSKIDQYTKEISVWLATVIKM